MGFSLASFSLLKHDPNKYLISNMSELRQRSLYTFAPGPGYYHLQEKWKNPVLNFEIILGPDRIDMNHELSLELKMCKIPARLLCKANVKKIYK
jgi:hypothetical protein